MSIHESVPESNSSKQPKGKSNTLQLIWKYRFHYLIIIPAMLLLFVFKIIPFLAGLYSSFVEINVALGLMGSPWLGLAKYKELFLDTHLRDILINTLVMKLGYTLLSGIVALIIALMLSSIQSRLLRNTFSTLFLIPYFIPSVVFAYVVIILLSPGSSQVIDLNEHVLGKAELFQPLLILLETIQSCGIPILIALAAIGSKHAANERDGILLHDKQRTFRHTNFIPASRAILAFMLLQLSTILSTDFDLTMSMQNALVRDTAETIDTYNFRNIMNLNDSSVISIMQFGVQFLFTLLAYFIIKGTFLRDLFSGFGGTHTIKVTSNKGNIAAIVVTVIGSLATILLLYLLFIYPFIQGESRLGDSFRPGSFILYMLIHAGGVVIHLLMTVTLAYPLTVKRLPGQRFYKLVLIGLAVMGTGFYYEYMVVRDLGMVNTLFSQLIYGCTAIVPVFVLTSIFNSKYAALKEQADIEGRGELHSFFNLFIPRVWKPLLALGVLQFVYLWNSFYSSLLYIASEENFSPVMQFHQQAISSLTDGGTPTEILQLGALLSLPPIVLFLIFRKWITSEVLIGHIRKL